MTQEHLQVQGGINRESDYLDHTNIALKPMCSNLERKDCRHLSPLSRMPSVRRSNRCFLSALSRAGVEEIFLRPNGRSDGQVRSVNREAR